MVDRTKILQITVRADIGGGPEHLYQLVKGSSNKFEHVIATPKDDPYYALFTKLLGRENCIEVPHRKFRISTFLKLVKEVRRRNISIIHSHGKGAGIYGRLVAFFTANKSLHTLHGFHVGNYNRIQKTVYIFIERILSKLTKKIIAVSDGEMNEIVTAKICNKSKVIVIANGVELPKVTISHKNFSQHPKKIMMFSRFNYQKNTELLVEIVENLQILGKSELYVFEIFGSGEDQDLIRKLIDEKHLGKFIKLMGEDADARSKLVEGFCYISTSRWEGLPISLLEAMAVGLPVLASDVVGNNNIIDDGKDGYLFKQDNIKEAIDKLTLLTEDEALWTDISKQARSKVEENYSIDQMINKIEKLYIS